MLPHRGRRPVVALVAPEGYGRLSAVSARVAGFAAAFEAAGWTVRHCGDGRRRPSRFDRRLERVLPERVLHAVRGLGVDGQVQPLSALRLLLRHGRCPADVAVVTVPPMSYAAVALLIARRSAVVLDYRDAWALADDPPALARLSRPLERAALSRARAVTFAGGPQLGDRLARLAGPRPPTIARIPNGVDAGELPDRAARVTPRDGSPLDLVIAGQIYGRNDWAALVRALVSAPGAARLEIIGSQPPYVRDWFAPVGDRVRWSPAMERPELYRRLSRADAGVLAVGEEDSWRTRIPVKVYEYRACGLPIVAICPAGAAAVEAAPEAHRFDCGDWAGLASLFRAARADRTRLRRPPADAVLDRATAAARLVRLAGEVWDDRGGGS